MGKVILDTDVIIEFFNKNADVAKVIIEDILIDNTVITVINEAEIIKGSTNKESKVKIENYISDFKVLPITQHVTEIFINLIKKYHLSHSLQIPDALIAAIAINYNVKLFTLNTKDFNFIQGLILVTHSIKPVRKSFWS